jgi:hypothetical protein
MMQGPLGAVALVILVVAVFWLIRRHSPPVTCPRCRSGSWIIMGEMKECRDCGCLFS